jgi:hypothetical protein
MASWGRVLARAWFSASVVLAPSLSQAKEPPVPAPNEIVVLAVVDSSTPVTLTKSFEVSWPKAFGKETARIDDWKGPASKQPDVLPLVTTAAGDPGRLRVEITLRDVSALGVYSGRLVLVPENGGTSDTKTFDVRFVTTFKPSVSIAPTGIVTLKVSNCDYTCFITELFAPETRGRAYSFEAKNSSPAPVDVSVRFTALGITPVRPAFQFVDMTATNDKPVNSLDLKDIPPNGSAVFQARIESAKDLPAGSYAGTFQFLATPSSIRDSAQYLVGERATDGSYVVRNAIRPELAGTVLVRAGAFGVLIAVILGVLAGRFASVLATAGFEQKLQYFPRREELLNTIRLFPSGLRSTFENYLAEAWDTVLDGGSTQTNLQNFTRLGQQISLAKQALELQDALGSLPTDVQAQVKAKIELALAELRKRTPAFDTAITAISDAQTLISAQAPAGFGPPSMTPQETHQRWIPAKPHWLEMFFAAIGGTGTAGVSLYYRYVRPLMHFSFLLVLVVYGVWQHYSGGADAATFGAQGISQYAGLFLWGVSSEIVNKTLQTITFKRA